MTNIFPESGQFFLDFQKRAAGVSSLLFPLVTPLYIEVAICKVNNKGAVCSNLFLI